MIISLTHLCTYDPTHKYAFVADYAGTITVLKLDVADFRFITTLNGHQSKHNMLVIHESSVALSSMINPILPRKNHPTV